MPTGLLFAMATFAMSSYVVGNAFMQKQQFYPTVVYLTKSNSYMAVLYIQAFVLVIGLFKFFRWVFFGQLRSAESEHLVERLWYAVPDTCLAFTFFSEDFSPQFVAMFTVLFVIKAFHWLAEDRIDFMDRSPHVNWLFHLRAVGMILLLGTIDTLLSLRSLTSVLNQGPSVQVVFAFEYAILLTIVGTITVKYTLHSIDLAFDHPWENKPIYLLYADLCLEFIRVMLYYTLIYFFLVKVHTPPLFAFRPSYQSFMRMYKCVRDIIQSRRAIANMNALPDATAEQLANQDNVCIVCRDEMQANGTCKVLPCSHIFHMACLRRWFQRQQTCPTCRTNALTLGRQHGAPAAGGAQPAAHAAAAPAQQMPGAVPPAAGMPVQPPFMWPPPAFFPPPPGAAAPGAAAPGAPEAGAAQAPPPPPGAAVPPGTPAPFGVLPPFPGVAAPGPMGAPPMMVPPFFPPPPPFLFGGPPSQLPVDLSQISDEQLRNMEGEERRNVEARVQVLRNIQKLLDAAVQQMEVYYTTASQNSSAPTAAATTPMGGQHSNNPDAAGASSENASHSPGVESISAARQVSAPAAVGDDGGTGGDVADTPAEIRQRRLDWLRSTSQLSDAGASSDAASSNNSPVAVEGVTQRRTNGDEDDLD